MTTSSHTPRIKRRRFLQASGAIGLQLGLGGFTWPRSAQSATGRPPAADYDSWQDIYRDQWRWDKVSWGSHTNQCAPGGCSFRVYSREGVVWREEQTARSDACSDAYPDFNPQGCQKGCGFHFSLQSGDRVLYPLKRVGERGEGKWRRISWDAALEEIADAILDAHRDVGPASVVLDAPHIHAGSVGLAAASRTTYELGGIIPDLNVGIGDDLKGILQTFGKMNQGYTADNFFDAELIILTHSNVSYTWPSSFHFVTEARYNGSEVVVIAPDYNASALVADIHIPVRVATDAAFWLGVCHVLISEGLVKSEFVCEQTDLPLLVRSDTGRYLRASEVDGGRDDQFYFFDVASQAITPAPRDTLGCDGERALSGRYLATLADGTQVEVVPSFELLRQQLADGYTPEHAARVCGVHPDAIRIMARKVASKRTCSFIGFTSAKHFHGDLMERSLLLAMALTGNWGKPGTGFNCFLVPEIGMQALSALEAPVRRFGLWRLVSSVVLDSLKLRWEDPDISDELITIAMRKKLTAQSGSVPPVFYLYDHVGYRELWDVPQWQDPSLERSFGEYLEESLERDAWVNDKLESDRSTTPQVLILLAHNPLRRARSGRRMYVENLFPKLEMLFTIDPRLSSTAMFCDIVLPAAWYYEKTDLTMTFGLNPYNCLIEQAVDPPGEARPEWEIFASLMRTLSRRAAERGMKSYLDRGERKRRYSDLYRRFTMDGHLETHEDVVRELVDISERIGTFPKGFDFEQLSKQGQVRVAGIGDGFTSQAAANEVTPGKPFFSLRWHVDDKKIYPTHVRRAQFYIDHPLFLEAGEALPVHKETPAIGGDHPFRLISGHFRGSIHSLHLATPELARLHRGQPVVFVNDRVAADRGILDGERVRIFNDVDSAELMVSTSAAVGRDQVVIYVWEPFQFAGWKSHDSMLVGLPKATQLAGDYTQMGYHSMTGSPTPASDRGLRVDIAKLEQHSARAQSLCEESSRDA
ncbi:MAG: molybdopterin-dependent oxidoreductase [bacterium]|nr:molybdopterin-dependent oxidoreductase [bacterium]